MESCLPLKESERLQHQQRGMCCVIINAVRVHSVASVGDMKRANEDEAYSLSYHGRVLAVGLAPGM